MAGDGLRIPAWVGGADEVSRQAAYAVGYRLVSDYLEAHPGVRPSQITLEPAATFKPVRSAAHKAIPLPVLRAAGDRLPLGGPEWRRALRPLLGFVALAVVLAGCGRPSDLPAQRVRQLMAIWESGDAGALDEIADPNIVYDDVPNGARFEGLDGVRHYVGHVHSWASQVRITVTAVHAGRDAAVAEWVMRGVQDRPIPGRLPAATNRAFELKGATVVQLHGGRIVRAADYLDVLGFVVQLGGRIELPGGVVIPAGEEAAQQGDAPDGAARRR